MLGSRRTRRSQIQLNIHTTDIMYVINDIGYQEAVNATVGGNKNSEYYYYEINLPTLQRKSENNNHITRTLVSIVRKVSQHTARSIVITAHNLTAHKICAESDSRSTK